MKLELLAQSQMFELFILSILLRLKLPTTYSIFMVGGVCYRHRIQFLTLSEHTYGVYSADSKGCRNFQLKISSAKASNEHFAAQNGQKIFGGFCFKKIRPVRSIPKEWAHRSLLI